MGEKKLIIMTDEKDEKNVENSGFYEPTPAWVKLLERLRAKKKKTEKIHKSESTEVKKNGDQQT